MVKASLVGSILGNILLVMGAAMFVGGLRRAAAERRGSGMQQFSRTAASAQSSMLLLAIVALAMPAVYELVDGTGLPKPGAEAVHYGGEVETLSLIVACVLLVSYAAGLFFSLKTHRDLFNPEDERGGEGATRGPCAARSSRSRSPASPSA